MKMKINEPKFPMGNIVATQGAQHLFMDDKQSNDDAVKYGNRVLSAYDHHGERFWIITEWDRSFTTLLLPEEY